MKFLERSALWQLTWTRTLGFLREPEALFWVFAFPVLMSLALGIAFRNSGPQKSPIGVEQGPFAERLSTALSASPDLGVTTFAPDAGRAALRRGKISALVRAGADGTPVLVYDPSRPETRLARLAAIDALERAAGRVDRVGVKTDTAVQPGSRYIDFVVPGLLGLNLLGTGMWGIAFPVATARQQKRLKRVIATPMRRGHYLISLQIARLFWLVLEVVALFGFARLAFGITVHGSWIGFAAITIVGALAFSALGLLVACRARTIEGVSGLMNMVMMPMWLLSGSFFSADRFPHAMQPLVQALPLTVTNNALRALVNEGAGFGAVLQPLAILVAWTVACFVLALRWFRWE